MTEEEANIGQYKDYIAEHRQNVRIAFDKLLRDLVAAPALLATQLPGISEGDAAEALAQTEKLVLVHDMSKYRDEEFLPYRVHFYPTAAERDLIAAGEIDEEAAFLIAWRRHCVANPHHPVHWANADWSPKDDMLLPYVLEAICDWEGMAIRFGGDARRWWESECADRDRAMMTDKTREAFDRLLFWLFR